MMLTIANEADTMVANGGAKNEVLAGRQYRVAKVKMIVPGVLAGSKGALLYTANEIKRSVQAWNAIPIVVDHPKVNGKHISARTPEVINASGVGYIFKARIEKDVLVADAWIDMERIRDVSPDAARRIERGETIEVSTGLGTDVEHQRGTHNGTEYTAIAKNYAPDHLAILPDSKGACSISDGCGLSVNELAKLVEEYDTSGSSVPFSQWYAEMGANEEREITIHGGCRCKGTCNDCSGLNENESETRTEAMTFSKEQRSEVISRIASKKGIAKATLEAFDDNTLVGICNAMEEPSKDEEKKPAKEPVNEDEEELGNYDKDMQEKIKNMAEKMAKNMFEKMKKDKAENEVEVEIKAEKDDEEEMTEEETANKWLKAAPEEIRKIVENARAVEQAEREELIQKIVANSEIEPRVLQGKATDDLRLFASLVKGPAKQVYSYAGAASPATLNSRTSEVKQAPLSLPTADYMTPAGK